MARSYVFLVHGVGRHEVGDGEFAEWAAPWRDALITQLRRYAPYDQKTSEEIIADDICFWPVSYDAIFRENFQQVWGNLAGALVDNEIVGATPALKSALESVANSESAEDIEKFFWDNALDAILWFTLGLAHASVKARVAKQLVEGIAAMADENNGDMSRAHIVAHSLGTSVIHDTVVSLAHESDLHEGVLDPTNFSWQSITMVANTSRLLEAAVDISPGTSPSDFKAHTSICRPGQGGIVDNYVNVRHQIDPITWPRMFSPDWASGYREYRLDRFSDPKAVHDFEHYVQEPRLHRRMLRMFLGNLSLGDSDERKAAKADYEAEHPQSLSNLYQGLRDQLPNGADLNPVKIGKYLMSAYKELA